MALRPMFEVCARETGYERVGRRREVCCFQEAPDTQLRATLVGILQEAMRRRRVESNTQCDTGGGTAGSGKREFGDSGTEMGSMQVGGGINAGAGVGVMAGLGASVWGGGYGGGDRVQGGG